MSWWYIPVFITVLAVMAAWQSLRSDLRMISLCDYRAYNALFSVFMHFAMLVGTLVWVWGISLAVYWWGLA